MHRTARPCVVAAALAAGIVGCAKQPVRWSESAAVVSAPGAEMRLAVDSSGGVKWLPGDAPPRRPPLGSAVCPGSLRIARAGERDVYAVWWAPRADSTAILFAARSTDDGENWLEMAPVDTADRGRTGCQRPPASVAADTVRGYVHVAYSMIAPGAPGVFFAHSMPGPLLFHAPVAIIYGERPVRTSVAASGDIVAVAYEDPNAAEPRVGLALSRTLGHTFDHRLAVSTGVGAAVEPRVALAGNNVAVAWRQQRSLRGFADQTPRTDSAMMVRLGELSGP
jgi:hypothetical protein